MLCQVRYGAGGTSLICHKVKNGGTVDPLATVHKELETDNWYRKALNYPIINSLGGDFRYANKKLLPPMEPYKSFGGFKILNQNSPLLVNSNLKKGDILMLDSSEWEGVPILGFMDDDTPILNKALFNPYRIEFVGIEHTNSEFGRTTQIGLSEHQVYLPKGSAATWVVVQNTPTSGYIINAAAEKWTMSRNFKSEQVQAVVRNMISVLYNSQSPFSQ